MIPAEVKAAGAVAVRIYRKCRRTGGSERLAIMLALRSPQTIQTSDTAVRINRSGMQEWKKRQVAMAARKAGMAEEQGYDPMLADHPNDTSAMFESGDQYKRRKRAFHSRGAGDDGSPKHRLHPQIIAEEKALMISREPGLKHADQRELAERIIDEKAPKL